MLSSVLVCSHLPQSIYKPFADDARHNDIIAAVESPNRNALQGTGPTVEIWMFYKFANMQSIAGFHWILRRSAKVRAVDVTPIMLLRLILWITSLTSNSYEFRQPCSICARGAPEGATGTAAAKPQRTFKWKLGTRQSRKSERQDTMTCSCKQCAGPTHGVASYIKPSQHFSVAVIEQRNQRLAGPHLLHFFTKNAAYDIFACLYHP